MENGFGAEHVRASGGQSNNVGPPCGEGTESDRSKPENGRDDRGPAPPHSVDLQVLGDEIVALAASMQADADRLADLRARFDRLQE